MALENGYVPEVCALIEQLAPFLPKERPEPAHWISTPDGDLGNEWCGDCGHYKVRNLRRRDRKRRTDYILDGGWRAENDNFPYCVGCGKRLDACPTEYCISETIHHFETCGFSTDAAEDAFEIEEVLDHLDYRYGYDQATEELRTAAIKVAASFLAQHQS